MDKRAIAMEAGRLLRKEGNCGRLLRRFLRRVEDHLVLVPSDMPGTNIKNQRWRLRMRVDDLLHWGTVVSEASLRFTQRPRMSLRLLVRPEGTVVQMRSNLRAIIEFLDGVQ